MRFERAQELRGRPSERTCSIGVPDGLVVLPHGKIDRSQVVVDLWLFWR